MSFLYSLVGFLSSSLVAWWLYSWICLFQNYLTARKVGVPLRILPISHGNPFWMIVDKKIIKLFKRIPFGNGNLTRYNWRGWEIEDKCRSHLEMGDVYMHVTPGKNWLYVCNPDSLVDIFRRRTDFPRPLELFALLNVFGPNLSTVDGEQWKRQRKITSSCFNEHINEIVWMESLSQATQMLHYWSTLSSVRSTANDLRTLSLNVLSRAGFGKLANFQGHTERSAASGSASYKDSLQIVLENCILIMAMGKKFISSPWLPPRLRRVHEACVSFQRYLTDLYESEKSSSTGGQSGDRNLMNSLVRASAKEAKASNGLSEPEIYGNMFVFNFAGHDTTTHTLTFAVMYLAINPSVQNWISEEICHVFGDQPPDEWDYASFSRLKRCLAVMMETVRLYTPVPVAKWTDNRPQSLKVAGKTILIPENVMVIASYAAMHTHPMYWGFDAHEWRPSRFIKKSPGGSESLDDEELISPQRGTFFPWSEGDRSCPGKKFSQVEVVATLAGLFRHWWADPVTEASESIEDARKRVLKQLETDSAQVLLLQMLHPERAPLVWKKRSHVI